MPDDKATQLLRLAQALAAENPTFQTVLGPGAGNLATNAFVHTLRQRAAEAFGLDFSECKVCGATAQAVDYYFPSEATIVELAFGLPNPASEFEKDVLKAIMAREHGRAVSRLYFISRPGAARKCSQPGRTSVQQWAREKHDLVIEVHELGGEPRSRAPFSGVGR